MSTILFPDLRGRARPNLERITNAAPDLYLASLKALGMLRVIQAACTPESDEVLERTISTLVAALDKAEGRR